MKVTVKGWAALAAAAVLSVAMANPASAQTGQNLKRIASNFAAFNDTFFDTGGGLISIYDQIVTVPGGANTMYVTLTMQSDTCDDALFLSCAVDGAFCNPGSPNYPDIAGFIAPYSDFSCSTDEHDVSYQWCTPVTKGAHEVLIAATSQEGFDVNMEGVSVQVDVSRFTKKNLEAGNGCAPGSVSP